MNEYEIYTILKIYRIVLRLIYKEKMSKESFYQISYNIICFNASLNKNQWVPYIGYIEITFNIVYTYKKKSKEIEYIRKTIFIIYIQSKYTDIFFRLNKEILLGGEFDKFIVDLGIIYELISINILV